MARTMTPVDQLDSTFDEVDAAYKNLKRKEKEEEDAQTEAGKTSGLVAAARRELKNAEARYRVLSNVADAETKDLQRRKVYLKKELAATMEELVEAENNYQKAEGAKKVLSDTAGAVDRGIAAANAAVTAVGSAKTDAETAQGTGPGKTSADLRNGISKLNTSHGELEGHVGQLGDSREELRAEVATLESVAADAANKVNYLTATKRDLEKKLKDIGTALDERAGGDLEEVIEERDAARRANEVAPDAEKQGQAALKQAREAREEAQERHREALAKRNGSSGCLSGALT